MLNFFLTKKVVVKFILFYTFFTNYLSQKGFCAPSASTSPTCRRFQCSSHQIPNHHWPSTLLAYHARPGPGYDVVKGTRTKAGVPLRHGGLDRGSASGEHKVFGTSIRSVPNGECNVDDSQASRITTSSHWGQGGTYPGGTLRLH